MGRNGYRRNDRGAAGLMEILVAIGLMAVAGAIVTSIILNSNKVSSRTTAGVASQSQLLDALSRITRDIAVANPIIEAKADSLTMRQVRGTDCLQTRYSVQIVNGQYNLVSETSSAPGQCPAMDVAMSGTPLADTIVAGLTKADGQPAPAGSTLDVFTYFDASNQPIGPGSDGKVAQPNRIERVGINLSAKVQGRSQGVTLKTSMAPRSGLSTAGEPRPSDVPPGAPTLAPIAIQGCADNVDINWSAVPVATGYMILRDGTSVATVLATAGTTYHDSGLEYGRTYVYEVYAQTAAGLTPPGQAQTVTRCPSAPHLTGQEIVSDGDGAINDNRLTWSRPSGTVSYIIYRNGTALTTINNAATTTYVDRNRPWSQLDHYTITALNAGGESAPSNDVPLLIVPAAPALAGVVNGATNNITLTVTPNSASDGYRIWLANGTLLKDLAGANNRTFTLAEPWGSTTQWYATAYNATGDSLKSNQVAGTIRPSAPALSGNVTNVTTSNLSWTAPVWATEYRLFRNGTEIYRGPNLSYTDSNRPNGATDLYVVYAVDYHRNYPTTTPVNGVTGFGGGVSDASNSTSLTIAPAAVTIDGRMCLCRDANRPKVTWGAASGATQYKILRDGSWVDTVSAPATVFDETSYNAPDGGWVNYQVIATNAGGDSPLSNTKALQGKPSTPGIGASPTGEYGTNVWWNAVNGATAYYILRDGVGVYWGGATSWHDPNTVPGWKYVYRVFAVNNTGYSGSSVTQVVQGTGSNNVSDPTELSFSDPQNMEGGTPSTAGGYRINWLIAFCIDLSSHGPGKAQGYSGGNWYWPWSSTFPKQNGWDSSYNGGYMNGPNVSYDEVARMAYALSKYGMANDSQKLAGLDAFVRTQTASGAGWTRANQRYNNMSAAYGWIPNWYNQIYNEAYAYGGPYGFSAWFNGTPTVGQPVQVIFRVWSTRTGNGLPNAHLAIHLDSQQNGTPMLTTDGGGYASIMYTPECSGTVGASWAVDDMPSTHIELANPNNMTAQRMVAAFPEIAWPGGASATAN